MSALDDYLKSDSRNMEALEYRVILLERAKRLTLAKQTAKTLLMLGGEESKFLDMYGHALLLAGEFDDAEAVFLRAYKLDPDGAYAFGKQYKEAKELSAIKKKGNAAVEKGDMEAAIAAYTTGIQRCTDSSLSCVFVFLNNRSACYINTHRYDLALRDIDAAIAEYPHLPKPYLRAITCIEQLHLTERMSGIPLLYLNALFSTGYSGSSSSAIARKYLDYLKSNGLFKSAVRPVGSKQLVDRVLDVNPDSLVVLDLYASWCGPCKVGESVGVDCVATSTRLGRSVRLSSLRHFPQSGRGQGESGGCGVQSGLLPYDRLHPEPQGAHEGHRL